MVRWTLALYPRAWRARYGSEVASLSEELIAEGDSTPWRAGLDLMAGAAVERGRALARSRRIAVVPAVAVLVAAAGTGWVAARPHPARTGPQAASLASVRCAIGPVRAIRVREAGRAASGSVVLIPARPGGQPGWVRVAAGQVRLKPGRCSTLPVPCAIPPPAGARALLRPAPGLPHATAGGATIIPGRCIVPPSRCKQVALPRGAMRASLPPGPGRIPGPPPSRAVILHPGTLRPATLRPAPGAARIPAVQCIVAAGVA